MISLVYRLPQAVGSVVFFGLLLAAIAGSWLVGALAAVFTAAVHVLELAREHRR